MQNSVCRRLNKLKFALIAEACKIFTYFVSAINELFELLRLFLGWICLFHLRTPNPAKPHKILIHRDESWKVDIFGCWFSLVPPSKSSTRVSKYGKIVMAITNFKWFMCGVNVCSYWVILRLILIILFGRNYCDGVASLSRMRVLWHNLLIV